MSKKQTGSTAALKRLMRYLLHYWFLLLASLLMAFISVALTLYLPILTGNAVDLILEPGRVDFAGIRNIADGNLHPHYRGSPVDHECV